ncbi:syntaxin-31 [Nicotiana sylvestris]|uniref:Syntaxin-31 n=1 Tax=Nicotiana sylvestris TaxID=4096 RepID=A0A1U7W082_NICSY|nr:PREDICTED: syntaxin-31 [Nicotiana sylvestris]
MSMASSGAWTYRDRTSEFESLSKTLKKIAGTTAPDQSQQNFSASTSKSPATPDRSQFNKKASKIGLSIHQTSQKIDRLAKLAKRSSIFDDPSKEIQELTALIKNDITTLNVGVSDLQTLQDMEVADGTHSKDRVVHCTAVCDDLKTRLMAATKSFQDALTTRTKNMKAHEDRKQIFSTNLARENPLRQPQKTVAEPPPWSTPPTGGGPESSVLPANGVQASNQLRRRLASDNPPSHQMEMSMLQEVVPRQESYSQSRASALQNVESTISELSGIFTHLATMVAQQGELAIRIDDNMDESLTNVEGAQGALLKYLNRISSNRWLMVKIFLVLILFLCVFIFFLA